MILETHKQFNLAVHLERKIEEVHGIHTPHNTIYKVLLKNGLVEENMKRKRQRKFAMKGNNGAVAGRLET